MNHNYARALINMKCTVFIIVCLNKWFYHFLKRPDSKTNYDWYEKTFIEHLCVIASNGRKIELKKNSLEIKLII